MELKIKEVAIKSAAAKSPFDDRLWEHPMLELYKAELIAEEVLLPRKLYLVPTPEYYGSSFNELVDSEFAPQPSPLAELPDLESWVNRFVLTTVEIWSGRRSAMQLARYCHRQVHHQLVNKSAAITASPKIRKLYISQPIEGVCETTVTLRIEDRVRSLILRFEGVDKRWLCTELVLL
jgi:hypothetical protein